jgi:hypothetical protein
MKLIQITITKYYEMNNITESIKYDSIQRTLHISMSLFFLRESLQFIINSW